jgi:two-component system alkaline phosphatase synthesis response regulator PhoP
MKKVLLCDDETHILRAAQIKLTRLGYDVQCANDGQAAWELIQQSRPDILVTDLQMPRMDGIELSRRVRENPATSDLPILMLTAKGFEVAHTEMAQKWNVLAILPKPFSSRELARCIENVLTTGSIGEPLTQVNSGL